MAASTNDKFIKTGASTVTTLSAPGKALSATSITVGSTTNYPTDTGIVFAIRQVDVNGDLVAGTYTEWIGTVTSATTLSLLATPVYGSDQVYPAGSTTQVFIPLSAAAHNRLIDGILTEHDQDGTHSNVTATSVTADTVTAGEFILTGSGSDKGWEVGLPTPDTITYNGNRSYDLVFNGTDLTDTLSPGMRLRTTRTVTAPTQCTDLESGSSQYWSKSSPTGISFTDDFTCMAWIKLESYTTYPMIISRLNSAGTQGWYLRLTTAGQVNIAGASTTDRAFSSYQSIPLGKWVHVAATLDMSAGTSTIYIDGVSVPVTSVGGNQTALTQAGDLMVGNSTSATSYFDGKIAQAAVFSSVLSAATIRSYASQTLAGNESTCVALFKMDGNGNDSNANANNLSASGSATATNADSPFSDGANLASGYTDGTTDFGVVMTSSFSTNTTLTVQVPEGCTIPTSGGVSAVAYSTQKSPFGFVGDKGRWSIVCLNKTHNHQASPVMDTWYNTGGLILHLPAGNWSTSYTAQVYVDRAAAGWASIVSTLSTSASSETDARFSIRSEGLSVAAVGLSHSVRGEITTTVLTGYYLLIKTITTPMTNIYTLGERGLLQIVGEPSLL